jgi:hypothetical protein
VKREVTSRGFVVYRGADSYGQPYSLQESSNFEPNIWLGGDGDYRAHLTTEMVRELIPLLQSFVDNGSLPEVKS